MNSMCFFLIYNIVINCIKLKNMRFLILLMLFFNLLNLQNNKLYSRNKEKSFANPFLIFEQKSTARIIYKDGALSIGGLNGNANLTIYSIIGNKVAFFSNIDLSEFKESIPLQKETMYIARIEFRNKIFTYKFFTR